MTGRQRARPGSLWPPALSCAELATLVWLASITALGCGRLAYDQVDTGTADAGMRDTGAPAADARTPDTGVPTGDFADALPVPELSNPGWDDDPCLTADLLEIYYCSDRTGGLGRTDIWRSSRAAVDERWSAPTPVVELNSAAMDETPGITADGLMMWLTSDRSGDYEIYSTSRLDRASPWSEPVLVPELSVLGEEDFGCKPASPTRMFFYRNGPSGSRSFETRRATADDPWGPPFPVDGLNTADEDRSPFLVSDLELLFSTTRPGGHGDIDVFRATRTAPDAPFTEFTPLSATVNSSASDDDPWQSPDGRTLFFSSERAGMGYEILEARR